MEEKKQQGQNGIWAITIVGGLVASVVIFAIMNHMQVNLLTAYERDVIYVAKQKVPEGTMISEQNVTKYFEMRELDKSVIPDTAIKMPEQTNGLVSVYEIDKGTLLTVGMFEMLDDVKAEMKSPVIAGFKAEDLYQVVGGTLRTGDRIDIYKIDEEDISSLIWGNVYVLQVFDNSGVLIEAEDNTTAAQRINVYLESDEVEHFYAELAKGSLRVVKVCD